MPSKLCTVFLKIHRWVQFKLLHEALTNTFRDEKKLVNGCLGIGSNKSYIHLALEPK